MKIFLFIAMLLISTVAFSQTTYNFEDGTMDGASATNMSITTTGSLAGGKSLETSPLNKNNTYKFTTPNLYLSGTVGVSFLYKMQVDDNWTLSVQITDANHNATFVKTMGSSGNTNGTFTATPPIALPAGTYTVTITYTTKSNSNDQNNRFWLDNIQVTGTSTFPVTFTGAPKVIAVFEDYVAVQFTVADQVQMKQYNVQFSRNMGKTWQTVAVILPDNTVSGATYTINVPLNSQK